MKDKIPNKIFNCAEVRYIEQDYARNHNGSTYDLMEKAGFALYDAIIKRNLPLDNIWIFVGKGNNGGDGYVLGSILKEKGIKHKIFAVSRPKPETTAYNAYKKYVDYGGIVDFALPSSLYENPTIVVDGLLGTGFHGIANEEFSKWISFVNSIDAYCISIDVPSGVQADTGSVLGECVIADLVVCMLALKPCLFTGDALNYIKEIDLYNLGVDTDKYYGKIFVEDAPDLPLLQRIYEDMIDDFPYRERTVNKGDLGRVLIIAGQKGMGGAALISAIAALRMGCGLVKVATDSCNIPAITANYPEIMTVDFNDEDAVDSAIAWASSIAIGPGLGVSSFTIDLLRKLQAFDGYIVYDADALNTIAKYNLWSYEGYEKAIFTPHPKEASRLLNMDIEDINNDRIKASFLLHQKYNAMVLLKGAGSVVCDGKRFSIINEGSPSMATAGMGDFLTGMIVSLLAQGLSASKALVAAACIHGRAGEMCANDNGVIGNKTLDLVPYIRKLINAKV